MPEIQDDLRDAVKRLREDFTDVEERQAELERSLKVVQYAEPVKYREGDFAFADGTVWNPGSGRGLYQRVSSAWVKL